jgi:hypothetical protein
MEREVAVIESKTRKVVARHTLHLEGLNYTPSDREYFDAAWQAAVDDGDVKDADRAKYTFVFVQKR